MLMMDVAAEAQVPERSRRVLVVDDDDSLRRLAMLALNRANLVVDEAVDGQNAIRRLEARNYAVVLLDLIMPNQSGFEVIAFLKERKLDPPPVVLVMTAAEDSALLGLDDSVVTVVLRKPLNMESLVSVVKAVHTATLQKS